VDSSFARSTVEYDPSPRISPNSKSAVDRAVESVINDVFILDSERELDELLINEVT